MVSQTIQFLTHFPFPTPHSYYARFDYYYTNYRTLRWRCSSGGRRWDWDKNVYPNQRSRFSDGYVTDDYDEDDDELRFRNTAKQSRRWWSDDLYDEDDEEDEDFWTFDAAIGFNWVSKVFQVFGWMIPAVIISLVMGTGPNTIIMSLALPLAQSAFSLATETLWGKSHETTRPKSKNKKRRPSVRSRERREREIRPQTRKEAGDYKSWLDANSVSVEKEKWDPQKFGGWDELDNQVRADKKPREAPFERAKELRARERVETSRRTKGEMSLLMRFLMDFFPYFEYWTKLF